MEIKLTLQLKDNKIPKSEQPKPYKRTIWVSEEPESYCGLDLNMLIDEYKRQLKKKNYV